ncbi:hypothetical protein [Brasilonema bromeliae]|uniref:hypothetical protein n=1 Tax=Brasilonema bromeliae TaxID=383615 RepID=UPI00145C619A|nr:hypothetical protein [Brasilonema bromeliae]
MADLVRDISDWQRNKGDWIFRGQCLTSIIRAIAQSNRRIKAYRQAISWHRLPDFYTFRPKPLGEEGRSLLARPTLIIVDSHIA